MCRIIYETVINGEKYIRIGTLQEDAIATYQGIERNGFIVLKGGIEAPLTSIVDRSVIPFTIVPKHQIISIEPFGGAYTGDTQRL